MSIRNPKKCHKKRKVFEVQMFSVGCFAAPRDGTPNAHGTTELPLERAILNFQNFIKFRNQHLMVLRQGR